MWGPKPGMNRGGLEKLGLVPHFYGPLLLRSSIDTDAEPQVATGSGWLISTAQSRGEQGPWGTDA